MKQKTILSLFVLFLSLYSCQESAQISIYNFDNKEELKAFNKLDLDKTHPNMLDPSNSKERNEEVKKSWVNLHEAIGSFLAEKDFTWEVQDSSVSIVQKFYFHSNGSIKSYFFKVVNSSVSSDKKEEYASLIEEFAQNHKIEFQMENSFAQCGKTRYNNTTK